MVFAAAFCFAQDTTVNDVVTRVHDGDTYFLRGMDRFCRAAGFDSPEPWTPYVPAAQPYGREAGDSVRAYLKGREVVFRVLKIDKYGRPVVQLFVDGKDLAETILTKGWAWYYAESSLPRATRRKYKDLEAKARAEKRGLFANPDAIPPTRWRARNPPLK